MSSEALLRIFQHIMVPSPACQSLPKRLSIIADESTVRSKSCLPDSNNRSRTSMIASGSPERVKLVGAVGGFFGRAAADQLS
jgi:hypothetical protein